MIAQFRTNSGHSPQFPGETCLFLPGSVVSLRRSSELSNRDNPMKFIHTADWQLGKPFARVEDTQKRSLLQQERFEAIKRIGKLARDEKAAFVLVAGDLFDSTTPIRSTVSAACSAIGEIGLPVIVIPGNHDHGGPGSIWEQEFFQREKNELAPNLRILLQPEPCELAEAILYPCPLSRRAEPADTTAWLRSAEAFVAADPEKVRIILAHGSTQSFGGDIDEEEREGQATNQIDLSRLPEAEVDYIALGDWHGTKKITSKAWYAGTPELDRFPKGDAYRAGNVLLVEAQRGGLPQVRVEATGGLGWNSLSFDFTDDASIAGFRDRLNTILGPRTNRDLIQLRLSGSLGIEASTELEEILESLEARVLRAKVVNETTVAPTEAEIQSLTERGSDPLISQVARKLLEKSHADGDEAATARLALRELHAGVIRGT